MRSVFAILTIICTSAGAGCGPKYIRGAHVAKDAEIEDKPVHRELLDMVERYRKAMEARDAKALLGLASKNYFERAGTTNADDDYGYDRLEQILGDRFKRLKMLRLHIVVDGVRLENAERARVDYTYHGRFLVTGKSRQHWAHKSWESRFRLERQNGRWWFLSGM
jgi:hypothetical protein